MRRGGGGVVKSPHSRRVRDPFGTGPRPTFGSATHQLRTTDLEDGQTYQSINPNQKNNSWMLNLIKQKKRNIELKRRENRHTSHTYGMYLSVCQSVYREPVGGFVTQPCSATQPRHSAEGEREHKATAASQPNQARFSPPKRVTGGENRGERKPQTHLKLSEAL